MTRKAVSQVANAADLRIPQLGRHKASGRAVVRLNGRDHYCGDWGTAAAKEEYERLISLWLGNGRRLPGSGDDLTIRELIVRYVEHADGYYRRAPLYSREDAVYFHTTTSRRDACPPCPLTQLGGLYSQCFLHTDAYACNVSSVAVRC